MSSGDADLDAAIRASMQQDTQMADAQGAADANDPLVTALMAMGFERTQCQQALSETNHAGVEQVHIYS